MQFPQIDPIAIHLFGNFAIRWYSLPYIISFTIGRYYLMKVAVKENFGTREQIDSIAIYGLLGAILFARLIYVILYSEDISILDIKSVFAVWEGGLSFHGGLVGCVLTMIYCSKKFKIPLHKLLDNITISTALGIFLGRIGNFINGELYGRQTNSSIGMIFPTDPMQVPRHPSQLYQSFGEGFLLMLLMLIISKNKHLKNIPYFRSITYVIFYSFMRFFIEFFREPDYQIGFIFHIFTLGQLLCIATFCIAFVISLIMIKNKHNSETEEDKH